MYVGNCKKESKMVALDKWAIYDHPRVNWQPHKGQLVVAENNCRHKVVSAGRRWGKSYMGGVDYFQRVRKESFGSSVLTFLTLKKNSVLSGITSRSLKSQCASRLTTVLRLAI